MVRDNGRSILLRHEWGRYLILVKDTKKRSHNRQQPFILMSLAGKAVPEMKTNQRHPCYPSPAIKKNTMLVMKSVLNDTQLQKAAGCW